MATSEELLTEILETAQEQLRWVRASVIPDVRKTIETTLKTTQLRRAYEMCDGENTGQVIATAVNTSPASVSRWTQAWRDVGIAYETEARTTKHLVSLAALGIPLEVGDG